MRLHRFAVIASSFCLATLAAASAHGGPPPPAPAKPSPVPPQSGPSKPASPRSAAPSPASGRLLACRDESGALAIDAVAEAQGRVRLTWSTTPARGERPTGDELLGAVTRGGGGWLITAAPRERLSRKPRTGERPSLQILIVDAREGAGAEAYLRVAASTTGWSACTVEPDRLRALAAPPPPPSCGADEVRRVYLPRVLEWFEGDAAPRLAEALCRRQPEVTAARGELAHAIVDLMIATLAASSSTSVFDGLFAIPERAEAIATQCRAMLTAVDTCHNRECIEAEDDRAIACARSTRAMLDALARR